MGDGEEGLNNKKKGKKRKKKKEKKEKKRKHRHIFLKYENNNSIDRWLNKIA